MPLGFATGKNAPRDLRGRRGKVRVMGRLRRWGPTAKCAQVIVNAASGDLQARVVKDLMDRVI